ncbi:hypothetical protein [Saccharopolyspora spinosa]|uniref:hypothetical protein n=1 Tax=Saccharopolyspora spinosa TaxID=60894 RepID=UPI001305329F|nr:hypothetical protein [Saccharopolyspora spinosa]
MTVTNSQDTGVVWPFDSPGHAMPEAATDATGGTRGRRAGQVNGTSADGSFN